jgi:hypothetical protein
MIGASIAFYARRLPHEQPIRLLRCDVSLDPSLSLERIALAADERLRRYAQHVEYVQIFLVPDLLAAGAVVELVP